MGDFYGPGKALMIKRGLQPIDFLAKGKSDVEPWQAVIFIFAANQTYSSTTDIQKWAKDFVTDAKHPVNEKGEQALKALANIIETPDLISKIDYILISKKDSTTLVFWKDGQQTVYEPPNRENGLIEPEDFQMITDRFLVALHHDLINQGNEGGLIDETLPDWMNELKHLKK